MRLERGGELGAAADLAGAGQVLDRFGDKGCRRLLVGKCPVNILREQVFQKGCDGVLDAEDDVARRLSEGLGASRGVVLGGGVRISLCLVCLGPRGLDDFIRLSLCRVDDLLCFRFGLFDAIAVDFLK